MEKDLSKSNNTEVKPETERDEQYAEQFWKKPGNTDNYKEVLKGAILSSLTRGKFGIEISKNFSEEDKEKLSAVRLLAKEAGVRMGSFTVDRVKGVAEAQIESDKDLMYANRFWERKKQEGESSGLGLGLKLVQKTEKQFREIIEHAVEEGVKKQEDPVLSLSINYPDITEHDKERLSVSRILAKDMGYEVGEFKLHKKSSTATMILKQKVK